MTLEKILDYAVPLLDSDSEEEKMNKIIKRARLSEMIEAYKRGEVVDFDPLISVDIEELIKKYLN